jgi:hypothetical protein
MARPAASSLAELILLPVDRRSMLVSIARALVFIELAVIVAAMFVLMTVIFCSSLGYKSFHYILVFKDKIDRLCYYFRESGKKVAKNHRLVILVARYSRFKADNKNLWH